MKVLIFSSLISPFSKKLEELSIPFEVSRSYYNDIFIELPNSGNNAIRIYVNGIDIRNFDLIYFRNTQKFQPFSSTIAQYLVANNIKFIDSHNYNVTAYDKLVQMMLLQINNLPTPKTLFMSPEMLPEASDKLFSYFGDKFIMKACFASHGNHNYLIKSKTEYLNIVTENPDKLFLFQEFIPNDYDYRLVTLGFRVEVIKKRSRVNTDSHLNNRYQGAVVEFVDKNGLDEIIKISEKAAELYKTEVAGVDVVIDKTNNKSYILEVNRAPDVLDEPTMEALLSYLASIK